MKKWITIFGVVVGLVILLLYQSEGRKMLRKEKTRSPAVNSDGHYSFLAEFCMTF